MTIGRGCVVVVGWLWGVVAFVTWLALEANACPTCKESLWDVTQAQHLLKTAKGYAMSIGLLIGTPLLLIGGLAIVIVHQSRRSTSRLRQNQN
jgi:hypothetical protein